MYIFGIIYNHLVPITFKQNLWEKEVTSSLHETMYFLKNFNSFILNCAYLISKKLNYKVM